MSNTVLTEASGYDINKVIFSEPEVCTVGNISYSRINIGTLLPNGKTSDLILKTERLFSFGVSPNVNEKTKEIDNYSMPLCIYSKDGATDAEKHWLEIFNQVCEKAKQHILAVKDHDNVGKYELEESDLKKFNPMYWKKEKGKIVEGVGPVLYAKLIESKKNKKMITYFLNEDTNQEISHLDLVGKYCYVTAAIKFESIYIGAKVSLQVKLYEASVKMIEMGPKRLLGGGSSFSAPSFSSPTPMTSSMSSSSKPDIKFSDSVNIEEEDEEEEDVAPPPPRPVSSTVKKVVPKKK